MKETTVEKEPYTIRIATPEDAEALLDIYAPYIIHTAITFEYEVPSVEEFRDRIRHTLKKYPYLVAQKEDGTIMGYAYTGPFKGRAAYDWAVETSIYIRQDCHGMGIGKELYHMIEAYSRKQSICNLYACIAYPEVEDEYLTQNSVRFHEHMGFEQIGRFHQCGYKFHRWYDMVWMEKILLEHTEQQADVIWFQDLSL